MLDLCAVVLLALLQTLYQFTLAAYLLLHLKLWSRDDTVEDLLMLLDWVRVRGNVVIVRARLLVDLIWVDYHLVNIGIHYFQQSLFLLF